MTKTITTNKLTEQFATIQAEGALSVGFNYAIFDHIDRLDMKEAYKEIACMYDLSALPDAVVSAFLLDNIIETMTLEEFAEIAPYFFWN